MKIITRTLSIVSLFCLGTSPVLSQLDPSGFIAGSRNDINYLADGYLSPLGKSLVVGLNNGWYQTAKSHKPGRFDVMITPSFIFIPESDQSFTIRNSELESLELVNGSSASTPTAFGEDSEGPQLQYEGDPTGYSRFNMPQGIGFPMMVTPMAGVSVGLIKNTDLSLRLLPKIAVPGLDEGRISMFGIGIKHDVLQWLPGDKVMPLDVSVFFGYSQFDFSQKLDDGSGYDDQEMTLRARGYTFRAIASKKLLFFTPYVGVGFNGGQTDINVNGTYSYDPSPAPGDDVTYQDPVSLSVKGAGGFVGNVGFRLKFLWVMAFSADYTFGAYNSATAGLGVSIDF